jgi:hypothetical protein
MNTFKPLPACVQITFAALVAALTAGGLTLTVCSAEPLSDSQAANTNSAPAQTPGATNTVPSAVKHQLTGAELYSIHCNRCHAERYPTERTAANWKTIMLHMQVRANIPGQQARLILQYLQENSGR